MRYAMPDHRLKVWMGWLAAMLFCLWVMAAPQTAHASAEEAILALECEAPPKGSTKLFEAVYDCIKMKFDGVLGSMVSNIFTKVSKAVFAALCIAIMLIASKFVLFGNRNPRAEVYGSILKFSVIASLLFGINSGGGILEFRDIILSAGQEFASFVFTADPVFGAGGADNIFQAIDKMMLKILQVTDYDGVTKDNDFGAFTMLGGLLFSGPIAASVVSKGGALVGMILFAFVLALFINVIAMIALTFLFALTPIILPLAMFTYTEYIMKNWLKQVLSYSLQPMILAVFLSMMLLILGQMIGGFEELVKKSKMMAKNPNFPGSRIVYAAQEVEKPEGKANLTTNRGSGLAGQVPMFDDVVTGQRGLSATRNVENQELKGNTGMNIKVHVTPFDPKEMQDLFSEIMMLIILVWAMMQFLRELPAWAAELAGGDKVTPNLAEQQPINDLRRNLKQ